MKNILINWRFLLLLIRQCSMKNIQVDYEKQRRENLKNLPVKFLFTPSNKFQNPYQIILTRLLKIKLIRFLLGNIAFLKKPEKSYRKFFINDDKKIFYLRIFKCGSTSVLRSLLPTIYKSLNNLTLTDKQIDSIAHYLGKNKLPHNNDYTAFTIIRNPLERVVSAYIDIFTHGDYGDFLFGVFKERMSFKDVLKTLSKIPDPLRGPHFASQHTIIKCSDLKNLVCFKLGEDNDKLVHFLSGFDLKFNHSNKSSITYNHINFYDIEALELTYRIYKEDFINLGYNQQYEELLSALKSK